MSSDIEQWPAPNDAVAFESLCLDLWKNIWNDSNAQKNGRSGHPQAGVDVFGLVGDQLHGVQCKKKDGALRTKLMEGELRSEVENAKSFTPPLSSFVLATTSPRDPRLQEIARQITKTHKAQGLFSVHVWSWEDIWSELYKRPELLDQIAESYWASLYRIRKKTLFDVPDSDFKSKNGAEPARNPRDKFQRIVNVFVHHRGAAYFTLSLLSLAIAIAIGQFNSAEKVKNQLNPAPPSWIHALGTKSIEPGVSIGSIALGDFEVVVLNRLGSPTDGPKQQRGHKKWLGSDIDYGIDDGSSKNFVLGFVSKYDYQGETMFIKSDVAARKITSVGLVCNKKNLISCRNLPLIRSSGLGLFVIPCGV